MLAAPDLQRGFTLIELLIGVVILAILFAAAAPSFRSWIQNAQVRTAADSISSGLQLARAEAVRRNTFVQFSLSGPLSTWSLGCVTPSTTCPSVIQSRSGAEGTSNAVVTVDNATVVFNGLGRANVVMNVNITNPTGGDCQIASGPTRCLNVIVSTGGQVRMCDPALPSSDPQGC
ncbi:MAG TPA: GspH/FimT family pseudopilin [Gallionellaceae bacterium]|nr:GspH/FimT family pseudopilin [Gallionellaceae bacterium]